MDLTLLITLAGLSLVVAGAIALGGAWAAVVAGVFLVVLGVLVDWEKLS
jgi:hypothetical protein